MLKAKTPLLVGLVVLLGAAAFIYTFGSLDKGVDRGAAYEVHAIFSDATGLVEGSRVMLSGIPIGEIKSVDLDKKDQGKARVTLLIEDRIELREGIEQPGSGVFRNGATAMRVQASLLGDYYVSVTPGIAGAVIGEGGEIRNIVSESGLGAVIQQIEDSSRVIFPQLEKISTDISDITGSMRDAFGGEEGADALRKIRQDVADTTENVRALSDELRTFMKEDIYPQGETVSRIMGNVERATQRLNTSLNRASGRLDTIMANVDTITKDAKRFVAEQTKSPGEADEGTVASAIKKLDKNMSLLEGSLENVRSVTAKVDNGEGTVGKLLSDDKIGEDLEEAVEDIADFTRAFSSLQLILDFHSIYLLNQGSMKHFVTVKIAPKPDYYFLIQVVDDPAGLIDRERRVTQTNDPEKTPVLVEEVTTTKDDLKITAQFAKRWRFLTMRYGIIESTGGFGVDVGLLEDSLRFSIDAFDFALERLPRLRVLAAWQFAKHVYVSAGVDDMINTDGRDYFVGIGFNFSDGDLRGALSVAPTP